MTSYAVIGTGGVGGFYGMNLAAAGAEVHFLIRGLPADSDRLELSSPRGAVTLRIGRDCQVHRQWSAIPPVEVAIVAVKSTANADVAPRLAAIVKPGGAVVLIQNGMDGEPGYAAALGPQVDVVGGLAFLACYRERVTQFVHIDYGALTLGAYAPEYAPAPTTLAMATLAADLQLRDIPVQLTDDLLRARWQKLVWNIPFNGLSVVLDARTDALMADPQAQAMLADLMSEVLAAAAGDGRELPVELPAQMLELTWGMKPYAPSMKLDYDHRRPLEVDAMYRAAIRRAEAAGVSMPRTRLLADLLTVLERLRRG